MKAFDKINPLDQTAGAALLALTVIIGGVVLYSNWLGIFVTLHTTNPIGEISPSETLNLVFSQPMRTNDVENQLQLNPVIPGKLEWQDDHTLNFTPTKPYKGNLVVHMVPGPLGANDEWLRKDISWQLTVRQPLILYLNNGEPKLELMTVPVTGGTSKQLTSTGGKIFDFGASTTGDTVAYSVFNDQKGFDLWLVDREGKSPHKLLDCGAGRCSLPTFSPDGKLIAYNHESAGITPNSPPGAPRPWIVDPKTGEDRPVFSEPQAIGYGVSWSPDGNWLATYDGINSQIRMVNFKSGKQVSLPGTIRMLGSWSPGSLYMLYPNIVAGTNGPNKTFVCKTDFKSGAVCAFVGQASDDENNNSFGSPVWSPAVNKVLISTRGNPKIPDRQRWLINPDTMDGPIIAKKPGYSYDFYQRNAAETELVFEQYNLITTFYPETAIWNPYQGANAITGGTLFPHWLS